MGARQPTFKSCVIRFQSSHEPSVSKGDASLSGGLGRNPTHHRTGLHPKTKREPESRLPLGTPVWLHRFGWEREASMKCSVYSAAASVGGRTDTNMRPLALVRNSTRPLISANKVWSLARPTLVPGCHLVPR